MKKIYLLAAFISIHFSLLAQHEFAPIGATWYLDVNNSINDDQPNDRIMRIKCEKDTVFAGHSCKKLSQVIMGINEDGSDATPSYDLYWYSDADTVFTYNYIFERYTPLYIFNLNVGDTFHVPVMQNYGNYYFNIGEDDDSTFMLIVDSVKTVQYDTAWAKSYYMHPYQDQWEQYPGAVFSWEYPDDSATTLQYNELMGCNSLGWIYPQCFTCASMTKPTGQDPNNGWGIKNLRCYHDSFTSVEYETPCFEPITSVNEISQIGNLKIYPNPANDVIYFDENLSKYFVSGELLNMQGKLIQSFSAKEKQIAVSDLPSGLYLLKFLDKKKNTVYKKISVMH